MVGKHGVIYINNRNLDMAVCVYSCKMCCKFKRLFDFKCISGLPGEFGEIECVWRFDPKHIKEVCKFIGVRKSRKANAIARGMLPRKSSPEVAKHESK